MTTPATRHAILSLTLLSTALAPGAAAAWTRAYVINWMEPALYYGGPENGGAESIGTDCPVGVNKQMDWPRLLSTPYRSAVEVAEIVDPEYRVNGGNFYGHLGFRGPDRTNVYLNPTSVSDPGIREVTGKIAEGFNLDGKPTGFTSPSGEVGIDNVFYKVSGCLNFFRGQHRKGFVQQVANEQMRDGDTTAVVVISGSQDFSNDDDVTVGIYKSKDKLIRDASNEIAFDFSYQIDTDMPVQAVFKAAIADGVLTSKGRPDIKIDVSWRYAKGRAPSELFQAMVRLETQADGSMTGLIGGYQDFGRVYIESGRNTEDYAINENLGRFSMPGWYYAMRRNADGLPNPVTGQNTGISTAYRVSMTPAFVVDPVARGVVTTARLFDLKAKAPSTDDASEPE